MKQPFYRAFEDRFRGSRELIKERLSAYRPFVEAAAKCHPAGDAVDLGCGRGEWLEVLQESGFRALGIDLDEGMLADCTSRSLPVLQGDAIAYLRNLPSETQALVSAFQLVEHIEFDQVRTIVEEALRVLKPGGLLILESPNAENLTVGSWAFYLDPTHERPIAPPLLAFVAEYAGFARTKILRLGSESGLKATASLGVLDVLTGTSPDFAIVAQKAADPAVTAAFDRAFRQEFGIDPFQLPRRYDEELRRRFEQVQHETLAALESAQSAHSELSAQSQRLQLLELRLARTGVIGGTRQLVAWARQRAGRSIRFSVRMGRALGRRIPVLKAAAAWVLRRSPFLSRQLARFSIAPLPAPAAAPLPPIRDFEQLRSVRIMRALSKLPAHGTEESITFLEVSDDVR